MALSIKTLLPTSASANNTTAVEAVVGIPDNCHTIIIYNPDGANEVYIDEAVASGSPLASATSTRLKAGAYLSLSIGTKSNRLSPTTTFAYTTSAGSIVVNISYVCTNVV